MVCIGSEQECVDCPLPHGKTVTIFIYTAIGSFLGEVPFLTIFDTMTSF